MLIRRVRRGLCLLCVLCLLAGCAAPEETVSVPDDPEEITVSTPSDEAADGGAFTLPYTANDTLDPYRCQTKSNQELTTLLFDPLVRLGPDMEPEFVLASDVTVNGTTCVVTLREAVFSDGSPVTPDDVTYSIRAARRQEEGRYAAAVANIASQSVASEATVAITLNRPDPYFANLLDFPIFKRETENTTNADNKSLPPVGSGRYVFHAEGRRYWLSSNPLWQGGAVELPTVELCDLPDEEAVQHGLQAGIISAYYTDLSDNQMPKMSGQTVPVPLFDLVFLGVNALSGPLSDPALRQALCAAFDREGLCRDLYYGLARPADGPLPAVYTPAEGLQTIPTEKKTAEVLAQLAELGYNEKDTQGYLTRDGVRLSLKLIYNAEQPVRGAAALRLAADLKEAGVAVETAGLDYTAYRRAVTDGGYDLYLGEMRLQHNFDLQPLLASSWQSPADSAFRAAAARFHSGQGTLSETLSCFSEELPLYPLCHRRGLLTLSTRMQGQPVPGFSDLFAGIEHCTFS